MILYMTKQTINELNIPMPEDLVLFDKMSTDEIIERQTGNALVEWGIRIFNFDGRRCLQAVNLASELTVFLFDIKKREVKYIADEIKMYLNEIYKNDSNMKELLERLDDENRSYAFSELENESVIASFNNDQSENEHKFFEYVDNGTLDAIKLNVEFNSKNMVTKIINGKEENFYPAEYFKKLLIEKYEG